MNRLRRWIKHNEIFVSERVPFRDAGSLYWSELEIRRDMPCEENGYFSSVGEALTMSE